MNSIKSHTKAPKSWDREFTMRLCLVRYQFWFLIVLFTLVPSTAIALAGIGEHDSIFHYNIYAKIIWRHPGEFCDRDSETSDRYCLEFKRESHEDFKDLETSLEEINVPSDPSSPYIIAKRSGDSKWLVYDLEFILLIFFGILAADSNREHKKAGLRRYLILYRLFTCLTGLSVLFVMAVIGFCTFV